MLGSPTVSGLLTHWSVQPVAIAVAAALIAWYLRCVAALRTHPTPWPMRRTVAFVAGVVLFVWTTCGWLEAYRRALFWVWTTQTLALLLVLPILVLAGKPLHLADAVHGQQGSLRRVLESRPARVLANPLVGPAVVPLLSAVLFFGPVPEWAVRWAALAWVLQLVVAVLGALIVLPLVGPDVDANSLSVGLSLGIGSLELVLDAIPGVVLRLQTKTVTGYFAHRTAHGWSPRPLHDQQLAGAILWCVAELVDVPFLLLTFRRWLAADARDAAQADAVLEAERAARRSLDETADSADVPWWLTDPQMRQRGFGRPGE